MRRALEALLVTVVATVIAALLAVTAVLFGRLLR